METFREVFGFIAAVCIGIMALAAFFTLLGLVKRKTRGADFVKLKGLTRDGRLVNVYLNGAKSVLGVRIIGFTEHGGKGGVPFQLSHMVVLETVKGSRILVRADSIRMIEEVEEGVS